MKHVELEQDILPCLPYALQDPVEGRLAINQQADPVVGGRLESRQSLNGLVPGGLLAWRDGPGVEVGIEIRQHALDLALPCRERVRSPVK